MRQLSPFAWSGADKSTQSHTLAWELPPRPFLESQEEELPYSRTAVFVMAFFFFWPSLSHASALKVRPTKLLLAGGKKTEVLRVTNEGSDKVTVQVEAMKWVQGEGDKDVYEPTEDIVFFPKIFTVEKGREVLLRVGIKDRSATDSELSYRVFLQEIPVSRPEESHVRLALRLSIPVFIKPAKEVKEWSIEKAELSGDMLLINIRNGGNSHMTVEKIKATGLDASGQEVFHEEKSGWYVLPGVTRTFGVRLPGRQVLKPSAIRVSVEVGESKKEAKLDVDRSPCPGEKK